MSVLVLASTTNANILLDPGPNDSRTQVISFAQWRATDPATVVSQSVGGNAQIPVAKAQVFRAPTNGVYSLQTRLVMHLLYESDATSGGASVQLESQGDSIVRLGETRVLLDWVNVSTPPHPNPRGVIVEVSTLAPLQAGELVFVTCTTNIKVRCPASALNRFSALLVHGGEVAAIG